VGPVGIEPTTEGL